MSASIDQLQIDINAQAVKANTAIDNLVGKLDKLSASLQGVNGSNLTGLANGVQKLGTAMQTMNSVNMPAYTRLAKGVKKLGEIDTASINRASSSMNLLSKSLKGLSGVSESAGQLGVLAKGISQLGYKASTQAIENIPKLATAMKELMTTLSKAPTVSQNLINMTNALAKLARTGASGGKAANSLAKNLNTYTTATTRATKGSFNLASAIGKVYASYWMLFRAFGKLGEAINISSDLTEVQNVVDVTFGKYKKLVEDMSNTSITNFGMSELTVKQISSRFQAMGVAMGFARSNMAEMSVELTKLAADMASFYNVEQADVAEDLESIFTGMTRPLRAYGLDLTQATLQEWAHRNGMEANMKTMSQAEKTMLRYQYVLANTGAAQGDFARTSNTWANQVRILKQNFEQLGIIIGGTLINALKPLVAAMNQAMSSILSFATTVSNALGQIFGWKYEVNTGGIANDFEDIAGSTGDIASGLGDAEKAAKKLRSYVLGIDELNIIEPDKGTSSNSGSGGGVGGGAGSGAVADAGNWVKVDGMFEKYKSEIDSLYKLGEYIGNTLTKSLNGIDWKKVYQGAKNFGKGLADFLNGLISPELFGAVGKTIAGALNTAIYAALSFGETFKFKDFGLSIATGINKFFDEFDFKSLAKTINVWAQGIKDTIITVLKEVKWKDVFKGISDFLNELELESVAIIVGLVTIKNIAKISIAKAVLAGLGKKISLAIGGAIAASLGTKPVITLISAGFKALFGGKAARSALVFMFPTLTKVLKTIGTLMTSAFGGVAMIVGGAITAIKSFIDMLVSGFSWVKEILMILGTVLAAIGAIILGAPALVTAIVAAIVAAIMSLVVLIKDNWKAIQKWFKGIPGWFDKNVIQPVTDFFINACLLICEFFSYLWRDIQNIWKNVSNWFNQNVIQPVTKFFKDAITNIGKFFSNLWRDIKNLWTGVSTWFNTNVIQPTINFFKNLPTNILNFFKNAKTNVINTWNNVSSWFNTNVVQPITNFFKSAGTNIKNFFSNAWTGAKNAWSGATNWFNTKIINPIKNAFKTVTSTISKLFSNAFSGVKKSAVGAMNGAIGALELGINNIVKGINSLTKGFNKVVSWGAKIAKQNWSKVDLVPSVSLPRIKGYEFGGYPNMGDLFFANENGIPELVGTIGGRTAVASGTEITGISDAVYSTGGTQAMLLQTAIGLLQEIAEKDMSVNIGDRVVARANNRGQKSMGAKLRTS